MDSDPITRKMMLEALQLAESIMESASCDESYTAFETLHIHKEHIESLKKRIDASKNDKRMKLTLGDHILLYTCFYLFTKLYSDDLTSQMLSSMDDMDTMHLNEPEIIQLRFYCEEMKDMMNESKERFASFPLFTKHLETLEVTFPVLKE
jgi:hypothetical protein